MCLACSIDLKGMSAVQRPKEFAGKMITASAGKLFCSACQEELSLKLSIHNTLHAQIIYTSPFINTEIKFISLMSK